MQIRGVTYDIGITTVEGALTRESLPVERVEQEMQLIKKELHCTAVRITGLHIERLKMAGRVAIEQGLDVWLSPIIHNADEETTLAHLVEAAQVAEELRQQGGNVVLVVGCELSVFMAGMVPGDSMMDRLAAMFDFSRWTEEFLALGSPQERFNHYLMKVALEAKRYFQGQITYAAGLWEEIDWTPFDFVGIDAYRDAANENQFRETVGAYLQHGKPVVVTEFGCCTYAGAEQKDGIGWTAVDRTSNPWSLRDGIVRDEAVQARYMKELLELFEEVGCAGAFVFTFVSPSYPSSNDPRYDLDTASYSLVRTWPEANGTQSAVTEGKKQSFHAVATYYASKK